MFRAAGRLYEKIAGLRNYLYDNGVFKSHSLGTRTISVGNITAGGTGKTPLVAYVADVLAEAGEKVCILTRGYGRTSSARVLVSDGKEVLADAREGGDEPVELAGKLLGKAIVVADADRVAAAAWANEKFVPTVFVLDDGFQHRRAKRDLDVVCIDASDPFGKKQFLRESVAGVGRAGAIVITRANLIDDLADLKLELRELNSSAPIFVSRTRLDRITPLNRFADPNDLAPLDWGMVRACGDDKGVRTLAFCALGNPQAFYADLARVFDREVPNTEFVLSATKSFADHHVYTQSDIDSIQLLAREAGVLALLTTAKDAVKLKEMEFEIPCFVLGIATEIDDEKGFRDLILT